MCAQSLAPALALFPEKIANSPGAQSRLLIRMCLGRRGVAGSHRPLGAAAPNSGIKRFSDTETGTDFQVIIPSFQEICFEKTEIPPILRVFSRL